MTDKGTTFLTCLFVLQGESVRAESNALVARSEHVELRSSLDGGVLGGLARTFLSGESMFMQTLQATRGDDNDILLAPSDPGDIMLCNLDGTFSTSLYLMSGSFLACEGGVTIETTAQFDLRKALFGAGLFVLHASGVGTLAIHSYGSLVRYDLRPGERRVVDNGHVVAWSEQCQHTVAMASRSLFTTVTSGEGMMCHFTGPGTIYVQSHAARTVAAGSGSRPSRRGASPILGVCIVAMVGCIFFTVIVAILVSVFYGNFEVGTTSSSFHAGIRDSSSSGTWD